jgi:sulfur-oxidizing protein SoxZ
MAGRMRIRAQLQGDHTEVKALMRHPMETGQRKDQAGQAIPAHFIEEVTMTHNGNVVMHAYWGAAVSANPFLGVQFAGGAAGDEVVVTWRDNKGETGESSTNIR